MMAAGELQMMPPTVANLEWLSEHASTGDVLAAGAARTEVAPILPKLRVDADGAMAGISLPGDGDYDEIGLDDPEYAALSWR